MRTIGEEIAEAGGSLALIGNGEVEDARRYAEEEQLPFRLLVDPQLVGYRAMELRQSVLANYSPRVVPRLIQALREGFRQGKAYGVKDQLGGVFVISPLAEVVYAHRSRTVGDEPPPDEILRALRRAASELKG
ncbi:MAG: peroxiredoxin-like family protein [Acidobacteriota bacterium]